MTEYKDGVNRWKRFFVWLFTGKRLLLSDKNKLTCPRCFTRMDKVKKEHVVIDTCPYCHGIWLDDGEIDKLVKIAKQDNTVKSTKQKK